MAERANEIEVKGLDLMRYRIVDFATHALDTAGLDDGVAEPGLALTPPFTASADNGGLLTVSEVARLRLDADIVILSACNTAGSDGSSVGEALSGLARAFLYAGARSMLVSHWPLETNAAVALTTGMFDELKRDPRIGRAEALRRSMIEMARDRDTKHPFFWAPFVVVGEGESEHLSGKIARLRIFADESAKMNRSLLDTGGSALVVSQFTLCADLSRGNRPGFSRAAAPEVAEALYAHFCAALAGHGVPVEHGRFAAHMEVGLVNDGPVTIWLDTGAG